MKKLLKKIWKAIRKVFNRLDDEAKQLLPVAIKIVDAVKKFVDSPVDDFIAAILKEVIPGEADNFVIDKIRKFVEEQLPKIIIQLDLLNSIAEIEDPNEKIRAILAQIAKATEDQKKSMYHTIASLAVEKMSDGKLTWSDSLAIAETLFLEKKKNETGN